MTSRADYRASITVSTRWEDVDHYGHVNNVVYYSYFDTAVNSWLMQSTGIDTRKLEAIGLVAETGCRFLAPLDFPQVVEVHLRVDRLGNSSITYALALFAEGAQEPNAMGHFVHVYVDEATRRPVPIPPIIRDQAERLVVAE